MSRAKKRSRFGMSINDLEVRALLELFAVLDRGGDPRIILRSKPIRRHRAALQRIADGARLEYGGRKRGDEPDLALVEQPAGPPRSRPWFLGTGTDSMPAGPRPAEEEE